MKVEDSALASLLAAVTLLGTACRTDTKAATRAEEGRSPSASTAAPTSTKPDAQQAPRVRNVAIMPQRWCTPVARAGTPSPWLARPEIQRDMYALEHALADDERVIVGTAVDVEHERVLVLFHTDYGDAALLARKLASRVTSAEVVLAPACHERSQIEEARTVLESRSWHPEAKSVSLGYSLDPAIAGFDVTMDSGAPQVVEALKARLGNRVRVTLGKATRT